jgi:hypothetical protein
MRVRDDEAICGIEHRPYGVSFTQKAYQPFMVLYDKKLLFC